MYKATDKNKINLSERDYLRSNYPLCRFQTHFLSSNFDKCCCFTTQRVCSLNDLTNQTSVNKFLMKLFQTCLTVLMLSGFGLQAQGLTGSIADAGLSQPRGAGGGKPECGRRQRQQQAQQCALNQQWPAQKAQYPFHAPSLVVHRCSNSSPGAIHDRKYRKGNRQGPLRTSACGVAWARNCGYIGRG